MLLEYKTRAIRNEFGRLTTVMQLLTYIIAVIYRFVTGRAMVVTAIIEGPHDPSGLHPLGRAIDVRSNTLTKRQKEEFETIISFFSGIFGGFAFLESPGEEQEHYHIQI
jgi:hypothetical protein